MALSLVRRNISFTLWTSYSTQEPCCLRPVVPSDVLQQVGCLSVLQGDTPLHAAAQHAGVALVKLLLGKGCNPVAENLLVSRVAPCCLHLGQDAVFTKLVSSAARTVTHARCSVRVIVHPTHTFCLPASALCQARLPDDCFSTVTKVPNQSHCKHYASECFHFGLLAMQCSAVCNASAVSLHSCAPHRSMTAG